MTAAQQAALVAANKYRRFQARMRKMLAEHEARKRCECTNLRNTDNTCQCQESK